VSELYQYGNIRLNPETAKRKLLDESVLLCEKYMNDIALTRENIFILDSQIVYFVQDELEYNESFYEFLKFNGCSIKQSIEDIVIKTISTNNNIKAKIYEYINDNDNVIPYCLNHSGFAKVYKEYLLDQFRQYDIISDYDTLEKIKTLDIKYNSRYTDKAYEQIIEKYDFKNLFTFKNDDNFLTSDAVEIRKSIKFILNNDTFKFKTCIRKKLMNDITNIIMQYEDKLDKFITLVYIFLECELNIKIELENIFNNIEFSKSFYTFITVIKIEQYISVFAPFLSSYEQFLNENFQLAMDNFENIKNCLQFLKYDNVLNNLNKKINNYVESNENQIEFRALKVTVNNKYAKLHAFNMNENRTYDLNIVNFECHDVNNINKDINMKLHTDINYYVATFNAYYEKKYKLRNYCVSREKSIITVEFNGFTISGNINCINIMMIIFNHPNSTITNILQTLSMTDEDINSISDIIINLQKCNYINYDKIHNIFNIPQFNKNIVIDLTEIHNDMIVDDNLPNIAKCYIIKMLKSASTSSFNIDEIYNHLLSLKINEFSKFSKNDTFDAVNKLLSKHIVKYDEVDDKYAYSI
jgi:hypothetical protein